MKNQDKDILRDNLNLKQMPFDVPAGYFDTLESSVKKAEKKSTEMWKRAVSYVSVAAVFMMLVTGGAFFLMKGGNDDFTEEDYIVFSDDMTNAILFDTYDQYADAVTEDDIIEYLIYSEVELEELY